MQQLRRVKSAVWGPDRSNEVCHLTTLPTDTDDEGASKPSPLTQRREKVQRAPATRNGQRLGTRRPRKNSLVSDRTAQSVADDASDSSRESSIISGSRSERTMSPANPKYKALKAAFDMIDTDNSGWISATELLDLLQFRGVAINYGEALDVIRLYGNGSDEINFKDFLTVMADFEDGEVIDLTRAFVNTAVDDLQRRERLLAGKTGDSLGATSLTGAEFANARLAFVSIVDGPYVHLIVFILIIVDVFCVIAELLLVVTWCEDPANPGHRRLRPQDDGLDFLSWRSGESESRSLAGAIINGTASSTAWCTDCASKQHNWEVALHSISISILCVFAIQILLVMVAYRLQFFKNAFFVLDAVVVGGALILELAFHVKEGALLVILLMWRMGRIIHGLVTTVEIGHKRMHSRINQVLRTQALTKVQGMKELKTRFADLAVAEKDLQRLRKLLEPTEMSILNVDTVPAETLRRNCKLQIMNNQEVREALERLVQDLENIGEDIRLQMEDASAEASRLEHHHSKTKPLRQLANDLNDDDVQAPAPIEDVVRTTSKTLETSKTTEMPVELRRNTIS